MCILHKWKYYVVGKEVEEVFLGQPYKKFKVEHTFRICGRCCKAQMYKPSVDFGWFAETLSPEQREILLKKIKNKEIIEVEGMRV